LPAQHARRDLTRPTQQGLQREGQVVRKVARGPRELVVSSGEYRGYDQAGRMGAPARWRVSRAKSQEIEPFGNDQMAGTGSFIRCWPILLPVQT
jgi:hypothetical protein